MTTPMTSADRQQAIDAAYDVYVDAAAEANRLWRESRAAGDEKLDRDLADARRIYDAAVAAANAPVATRG